MNDSPKPRVAPLSELAVVLRGYSPRSEERKRVGKYLLVGGRNLRDGRLVRTEQDSHIDDLPKGSFQRAIVQPGDIVISTLFDRRKLYIYRETDPPSVINNSCAIIRAPETNDYIISYLRTPAGREQFLSDASRATRGATIPRLSFADLLNIEVPILPLLELQRLGDEHIESSSTDDLIALRNELQSRDVEIAQLQERLNLATRYYEDRIRKIEEQISSNDLRSRIAHGETRQMEFKSSLRWNLRAGRDDPNMGLAVLKTIAAFCNSEGGDLFIGVADDHTILGIEHDHFENGDRFLLHLRNLILGKLVPNVVQYVSYDLVAIDEKYICHVTCRPSSVGVWLKADRNAQEEFYVRHGPSSTQLPPRDAVEYIIERFQR